MVLVCGWRVRRRRMTRVAVRLHASERLGRDPLLKLRPTFPLDPVLCHAGAQLTAQDLLEARLGATEEGEVSERSTRDFLTRIVRNVSGREPTVGSDVMSVALSHPSERRIVCKYDPQAASYARQQVDRDWFELPVTFNPWVLTPHCFIAPRETTVSGGGSETFSFDGWTIECEMTKRSGTTARAGWSRSQPRAASLPLPRR